MVDPRIEDLDRDRPRDLLVSCPVDRTHATDTEQLGDHVAAGANADERIRV